MIKVQYGGKDVIPVNGFSFPGGERHLSVPVSVCSPFNVILVEAEVLNPTDVMDLLLTKNALDAEYPTCRKELLLKYLPYARQDRIANPGEPHSLKVFCKLVTDMNFDYIEVWDVHSDVAKALLPIGKTKFVSQAHLLKTTVRISKPTKIDYLISPDAGAEKKIYESAFALDRPVIHAYKKRDPLTGKLSNPRIDQDTDLNGKDLLIVDDICDESC